MGGVVAVPEHWTQGVSQPGSLCAEQVWDAPWEGWVRLGAGSWPGHTSTSCIPTFQRMQVPDRDRKGRFSCTGIMCFEVTEVQIKSSLKRWWRFPQLERGGSYKGSKAPFSPSSWLVPSGHCCPTCVSIPKREILSIWGSIWSTGIGDTMEELNVFIYCTSCVVETSAV